MSAQSGRNDSGRVVAKNTIIIMLAQILGLPFSMLVNVMMGRLLGAEEYGQYYLLSTYASLAFLFVDWGLGAIIPARIANHRESAGSYLGSALSWNLFGSVVATAIMAVIFYVRGRQGLPASTVVIVCIAQALALIVKSGADAVRGFERTDVAAYAQVGTQFLTALLVIPVLLLGGQLIHCVMAIAAASLIVLVPVWRSLGPAGIGRLTSSITSMREMLTAGTSFLILNLIIYLQPAVDAYFLDMYASQESAGWLAAARKLTNPLLFPISAMTASLYPTLCRLWVQDRAAYRSTTQGTIRAAVVITMPLAIGCAAFADLGTMLFSQGGYGPVKDNLRFQAAHIFLLYFSMVMGTGLNAAGKQRIWSIMQLMCVVMSVVLDPILVPWFQKNMNNGGLGVNVSCIFNELLMIVAAVWLQPKGVLDGSVGRCFLKTLVGGAAMFAVAMILSRTSIFVAAPIAVSAYVGVMLVIGGIDVQQREMLWSMLKRRRAGQST